MTQVLERLPDGAVLRALLEDAGDDRRISLSGGEAGEGGEEKQVDMEDLVPKQEAGPRQQGPLQAKSPAGQARPGPVVAKGPAGRG